MIEETQDRTQEQMEKELIARIAKSNMVIQGLENHGPFKTVMEDFKGTIEMIDNSWHLVGDPAKLNEFRVTKMAAISLVNCLDGYKFDMKKATEELAKIQNPDKLVSRDYDPE